MGDFWREQNRKAIRDYYNPNLGAALELKQERQMANENKKYPLTVFGLYTTSGANSRTAIITQENADKACAAIQAAVGGKIAVRKTSEQTMQEQNAKLRAAGKKNRNGDYITFPDYFLEAVTPDLLAEERARMAEQNGNRAGAKPLQPISNVAHYAGDDAL